MPEDETVDGVVDTPTDDELDLSGLDDEPKPEPESGDKPEPEPEPEPEPKPKPEPEQSKKSASEPTPDEIAKQREAALSAIAKRYEVSKELREKLENEPGAIAEELPKMAARVMLETYEAVLGYLTQQLPAIIHNYATARDGANEFYAAWPDLKGQDELISEVGRAYMKRNPKATRQDFIRDVGAAVSAMLGKGASAKPPAQNRQGTKPHTPARTSGGAPLAPAGRGRKEDKDKTIWDELVELDLSMR